MIVKFQQLVKKITLQFRLHWPTKFCEWEWFAQMLRRLLKTRGRLWGCNMLSFDFGNVLKLGPEVKHSKFLDTFRCLVMPQLKITGIVDCFLKSTSASCSFTLWNNMLHTLPYFPLNLLCWSLAWMKEILQLGISQFWLAHGCHKWNP